MKKSLVFSAFVGLSLCTLFACGDAGKNSENNTDAGDSGAQTPASKCKAKHGAEMALLETNVETFCIDKTEVTRGEYREFLQATDVDGSQQPTWCNGVSAQSVDEQCQAKLASCSGDECGRLPQTCVNVCNAIAYCAWAGKELCGKVGGGVYEQEKSIEDSPPALRWKAACGNGLIKQPSGGYISASRQPYGEKNTMGNCVMMMETERSRLAVSLGAQMQQEKCSTLQGMLLS